jgi:hypothetical protein
MPGLKGVNLCWDTEAGAVVREYDPEQVQRELDRVFQSPEDGKVLNGLYHLFLPDFDQVQRFHCRPTMGSELHHDVWQRIVRWDKQHNVARYGVLSLMPAWNEGGFGRDPGLPPWGFRYAYTLGPGAGKAQGLVRARCACRDGQRENLVPPEWVGASRVAACTALKTPPRAGRGRPKRATTNGACATPRTRPPASSPRTYAAAATGPARATRASWATV